MTYDQQIQAYIHGGLSAEEAEVFEAAFFTDDALAAELDRALEIRAALGSQAVKAAALARYRRSLFPLAAAAGLAMIAFSLFDYLPFEAETSVDVMRGAVDEFSVGLVLDRDTITASWTAVAGASQYQVQVYRSDGTPLETQRTSQTSGRLNQDAEARFLRVTALGDLGNVLADSGLLALAPL